MTLSVPLLLSGLTVHLESKYSTVSSVCQKNISYFSLISFRASGGREGEGERESLVRVCGEILPGAQLQEDQRFSELLPG